MVRPGDSLSVGRDRQTAQYRFELWLGDHLLATFPLASFAVRRPRSRPQPGAQADGYFLSMSLGRLWPLWARCIVSLGLELKNQNSARHQSSQVTSRHPEPLGRGPNRFIAVAR
jgi:hypothetical protein